MSNSMLNIIESTSAKLNDLIAAQIHKAILQERSTIAIAVDRMERKNYCITHAQFVCEERDQCHMQSFLEPADVLRLIHRGGEVIE